MPTRKQITMIGIGAAVLIILTAVLLVGGIGLAPDLSTTPMGYEDRIFKTDRIHTVDILMVDWEGFVQTCEEEETVPCTVVINGETFDRVGVRAKGISSVSAVAERNRCRYSLKLEFDHYDSTQTYYGLDKLNLNNLVQDNTMMKDFLSYRLMRELEVAAPLCSYTKVYINGKSLGLYLAVEAMEESFLQRNYGSDHGHLYKPDADKGAGEKEHRPEGDDPHLRDVKLQYLGDDPERYPNIFDNAKTDPTEEDKARLIQALKQLSTGEKPKNAVDVEEVIRYFAVHTYVCNEDGYTGSTVRNYCLYEKDGKLSMLPRDYHLAFGGISTGHAAPVINGSVFPPVSDGRYEDRPMLSWILNTKKYTWLYQRYMLEVMNVDLEPLIDQTRAMIAPYVMRDLTKFCTYEEFNAAVDTLKQFLELRWESVQQQLRGKPANVEVGDLDLSAMGGVSAPPPQNTARDKKHTATVGSLPSALQPFE